MRAAAELAQAGGPAAVTIRAAARAVGVTPTAAYRHFAGHEALLAAVKERALEELARSMTAALDSLGPLDDPVERGLSRLAALGRGYFTFALAEPGLFRTAFTGGLSALPPLPDLDAAAPFRKLVAEIDNLAEVGYLPERRRPMAEMSAWAAVHGLVMLHLDGPLAATPPADRELALERTMEVIGEGLGGTVLSERLRDRIRAIVRAH